METIIIGWVGVFAWVLNMLMTLMCRLCCVCMIDHVVCFILRSLTIYEKRGWKFLIPGSCLYFCYGKGNEGVVSYTQRSLWTFAINSLITIIKYKIRLNSCHNLINPFILVVPKISLILIKSFSTKLKIFKGSMLVRLFSNNFLGIVGVILIYFNINFKGFIDPEDTSQFEFLTRMG